MVTYKTLNSLSRTDIEDTPTQKPTIKVRVDSAWITPNAIKVRKNNEWIDVKSIKVFKEGAWEDAKS